MLIEISVGEYLDKLTILELKNENITDKNKLNSIRDELKMYTNTNYKDLCSFEFKMLKYVNRKIWDLTDQVKQLTLEHQDYSKLAFMIFEFNQYRFRIKKRINIKTKSEVKEEKSYSSINLFIYVDNIDKIIEMNSYIHYVSIQYDEIFLILSDIHQPDSIEKTKMLFDSHYSNIKVVSELNPNNILLTELPLRFPMSAEMKNTFSMDIQKEFPPINYIVGGKIGDFVHQLSVVNEKYLETGRKGRVYLSDLIKEKFRFGIQKAYDDLKDIVLMQPYIHSFHIHKNEPYDFNLDSWRNDGKVYKSTWYHIYRHSYNIEWAKNKWLFLPFDEKYKDCILIGHSKMRYNKSLNYSNFLKSSGKKVYFVTTDIQEYHYFQNKCLSNKYECILFQDLIDLWKAISSCYLYIGNLSSPLAVAYACHKYSISILTSDLDDHHHIGIEKIRPELQWFRDYKNYTTDVPIFFNV